MSRNPNHNLPTSNPLFSPNSRLILPLPIPPSAPHAPHPAYIVAFRKSPWASWQILRKPHFGHVINHQPQPNFNLKHVRSTWVPLVYFIIGMVAFSQFIISANSSTTTWLINTGRTLISTLISTPSLSSYSHFQIPFNHRESSPNSNIGHIKENSWVTPTGFCFQG